MENLELIQLLNKELVLTLPNKIESGELHKLISTYINNLIKNDFEKLIANQRD